MHDNKCIVIVFQDMNGVNGVEEILNDRHNQQN